LHGSQDEQNQHGHLQPQQNVAAEFLEWRVDSLIVDDRLPENERRDFDTRSLQLQKVKNEQRHQQKQPPRVGN